MFVFNGTIACVLGLQRNSFYTTSQKSNLQLIQQETCRHPQGFVLLLPSAEKEPVPRTGTARAAEPRLVGQAVTLEHCQSCLPTPRAVLLAGAKHHHGSPAQRWPPGAATGLARISGWLLGLFCFPHRLSFLFLPAHRALRRFWRLFTR